MKWLRRWLKTQVEVDDSTYEPMSEQKVDFSFRIYWTKIGRQWDLTHIRALRPRVEAITAHPEFEKNLIDRRYRVEGLDDLAHSGASLLALLEVLDALENTYEGDST